VDDRRILILPPGRRDGETTSILLQRAGLTCCVCANALILADEMNFGVAVLVLTDAALADPNIDTVLKILASQPPWSDLPIVLLSQPRAQSPTVARKMGALRNVTLLDRPTSSRMLVSAVQAAVRGRLRQYETREQLKAVQDAEEALRIANRRKDEFLAMLAHELRNPLAPIRNASEILERMLPESPRLQVTAGIIKRQIVHLSRLVDDLLDISRITQGRIELQHLPVELSSVLTQAMESVESLMREKQHKVFVAASYEPLYVNGDHARLVQCLSNILTNAAKYTDASGEIHVEVRQEQSFALIAIADNGIGIPQELLPQIFDLFVQSERSLDRSQGGLGIGLSVVQRLIEMHGGRVSASSEGPGRGARFEVRLPLINAPRSTIEEHEAAVLSAKRILVVDDNYDAANSLVLILNLSGHTAEAVYGASEALGRASLFKPEVILLDIGLPGMDGYEVAKRLRAAGNTARIMALTGYGQRDDVQRGKAAGFNAHLIKPVDLQQLLRKLSESD